MSSLIVRPVQSAGDRKRFLEFPWQLYRGNPHWIPPLRREQAELAGYRRHPFYRRNEAQTFLALRGEKVCGRIAAIHNRDYLDYQKDARGFFGFFECEDDAGAARALLEVAREWLAKRGLHALRGPINPSINYSAGVLIEGFDSPPTFLLPYNRPYYAALLEGCGCRKTQDLYAYWGDREMLPAIQAKTDPVADQITERYGLKIRTLRRWRFRREVGEFLSVFNRSAVSHWSFAPLSPAEVRHLANGLRWLLVPDMAVAAEIDGKLVGVALALPDYNPLIRKIDGRLFPFGFLRLLAGKRKITKYRIIAANVLPEYQLLGLGLVLLRAMVPPARSRGIEEAEFSWVAESNRLSRGALEKGGAKRIKTYRVFDWEPS
ncbi:MAG: GNAT family N-acetyltransferase [Thermoguttaceae bacterium]|jgi:GNAT superfamily N-acetyltransferase